MRRRKKNKVAFDRVFVTVLRRWLGYRNFCIDARVLVNIFVIRDSLYEAWIIYDNIVHKFKNTKLVIKTLFLIILYLWASIQFSCGDGNKEKADNNIREILCGGVNDEWTYPRTGDARMRTNKRQEWIWTRHSNEERVNQKKRKREKARKWKENCGEDK